MTGNCMIAALHMSVPRMRHKPHSCNGSAAYSGGFLWAVNQMRCMVRVAAYAAGGSHKMNGRQAPHRSAATHR